MQYEVCRPLTESRFVIPAAAVCSRKLYTNIYARIYIIIRLYSFCCRLRRGIHTRKERIVCRPCDGNDPRPTSGGRAAKKSARRVNYGRVSDLPGR